MIGEKPLEDIVMLDFTRILAGPYLGMILANLGGKNNQDRKTRNRR